MMIMTIFAKKLIMTIIMIFSAFQIVPLKARVALEKVAQSSIPVQQLSHEWNFAC